ncbi:MAG: RUS1 family protein [Armatimonadetes bacterium]|nr:RUS1 family protein [Armatimonadota bacterium]
MEIKSSSQILPSIEKKFLDDNTAIAYEIKGNNQIQTYSKEDAFLKDKKNINNLPQKTFEFIKNTFLPENYEKSCSKDYLPYRKWMFLRNVADSALYFFTTAAVLKAFGIGAGAAVPTVAWLIQEWAGNIGRLFSSYYANKVDQDPKNWIFKGEIISQVGGILSFALNFFPHLYLPLSCASQMFLSGGDAIAWGGIGNIEKKQAINNNLAEMRAKAGNQGIVSSLAGLGLGAGLQHLIAASGNPLTYPIFLGLLIGGKLLSVYKATRTLEKNNLNTFKLREIVNQYFKNKEILKPRKESLIEELKNLFNNNNKDRTQLKVVLGAGVQEIAKDGKELEELISIYNGENYLLNYKDGKIYISYNSKADINDKVKSIFQAEMLEIFLKSPCYQELTKKDPQSSREKALELTYSSLPKIFNTFIKILAENGWDTNQIELGGGSTIEWKNANFKNLN